MVEDRRKRPPNRRLDSWKEIAAYFGRDERTVKRWEKDRGLPVRRLPGARGRVFSFTDDLAQWMEASQSVSSDTGEVTSGECLPTVELGHQAGASEQTLVQIVEPPPIPEPELQVAKIGGFAGIRKAWILPTALAVVFTAAAGVGLAVHQKRVLAPMDKGESAAAVKPATSYQPNAKALDLYLKGRYYWSKRTPSGLNRALDYFSQAIASDPNYAQAYVGIADCYDLLREYAAMPEQEAYAKATAAARKAVDLDNTLAEAHNSLAFDLFYGSLDAAGAEVEFQRALSLDPKCQLAHHWYATYLMTVGRSREALEQIEIAQQLNSSSTSVLADKGLILYYAGRTDDAVALLNQINETDPSFLSTHRYLALIDLTTARYEEYLAETKKVATLSENDTELAIVDAAEKGLHSGGPRRMLESMLNAEKAAYAEGRISAFRLAETSSLMGEKKQALSYLQISRVRRESALTELLVDPPFKSLHDDPSYRELISQVGLAQLTTS